MSTLVRWRPAAKLSGLAVMRRTQHHFCSQAKVAKHAPAHHIIAQHTVQASRGETLQQQQNMLTAKDAAIPSRGQSPATLKCTELIKRG